MNTATKHLKTALVWGLLALCIAQDILRIDYITHSHILAGWSADLDERWNTGVWTEVETR